MAPIWTIKIATGGSRLYYQKQAFEETRSILADDHQIQASSEERQALRAEADAFLDGRRPFHWPLELPEVFIEDMLDQGQISLATDKLGFTAIVGNPPFQGGQKITGALGIPYRDYLVEYLAHGRRGSADLCAYFFLRAGQAVQEYGHMGLLATNTIAQGDTREVGLDQLAENDYAISRAVPSLPWPGLAAVEIAHVWISRGEWIGPYSLNNQRVVGITPLLSEPGTTHGPPHRLVANQGKSFQGSIVLGMGFVLTPDEAQTLIAKDSRNREVIFPYLNGEDLNSRPDQSPSRWVINFQDWPLDKAETYPDCLQIVQEKVKPERDKVNRKARQERWWQFAERSPNLYKAVAGKQQVLVACRVTKFLSHTLVPANYVYDVTTNIFTEDVTNLIALLNSAIFDVWVRQNASSLETRVRYTLTDCFETFPFPEMLVGLNIIGEANHDRRRQLMLERQEGLTKIYNRLHEPNETSADIAALRRQQMEMNQAVVMAYGWGDLDLGYGFYETKQGLRYTISEIARRTMLDRLLALNHQRYSEEVALGLHDKGAKKTRERAKKAARTLVSHHKPPQLTMDLDISESVTQPQENVVIDFGQVVPQQIAKKVAEEQTPYDSAKPESTNEPDDSSPQQSQLDRHVILLARVIQRHRQHGYEKTLGHVKAEKIAHIIEAHCGAELGRLPVREAAGPADFQRLLAVAARGKYLNAFQDNRRLGERRAYQFAPLGNLKRTASKIEEVFGDLTSKIDQVIDLFVGLKTSEAEIVATLYAAWNDLLADGKAVDEDSLFQEFFAWSKSKSNFQRGELRRMKAWMEVVGLVPTGKAKRTLPLQKR